tara:strand:+ start:429 stop:860 length:432 start_codon:yes stop_codon:yes gene_type:complete
MKKDFPSVHDCKLMDLPVFDDMRGSLVAVESGQDIPFELKRIFYISDLKNDKSRGGHAHKTLSEIIICLSGSLRVNVKDGTNYKTFYLDNKKKGLFLPPMIWASETHFLPSTIYLVLASDNFKPSDYYKDYNEFEYVRNSAWQ